MTEKERASNVWMLGNTLRRELTRWLCSQTKVVRYRGCWKLSLLSGKVYTG